MILVFDCYNFFVLNDYEVETSLLYLLGVNPLQSHFKFRDLSKILFLFLFAGVNKAASCLLPNDRERPAVHGLQLAKRFTFSFIGLADSRITYLTHTHAFSVVIMTST